MTRRQWLIWAAVMAGLGIGAFCLRHLRSDERLGKPGVRLAAEPIYDEDHKLAGRQSVQLPEKLPGYESKPGYVTDLELGYLPKDTTFGRRIYKESGSPFWAEMSVVLMGADRGSIHKPQICLVGQGWTIDHSEVIPIPLETRPPSELKAMLLTCTRGLREPKTGVTRAYRALYVYWFVADGELTPYHGERMWWMARDMLTKGILQRWAYVSCQAFCLPGQENLTLQRMRKLLAEATPRFQLTPAPALATAGVNGSEARVPWPATGKISGNAVN